MKAPAGYVAVFKLDGRFKVTAAYTKKTLEQMVIPDVKRGYPNAELFGIITEQKLKEFESGGN